MVLGFQVAVGVLMVGVLLYSLIYGFVLNVLLPFRKGFLTLLAYHFIPFYALWFWYRNWEDVKGPLLRALLCVPAGFLGIFLVDLGSPRKNVQETQEEPVKVGAEPITLEEGRQETAALFDRVDALAGAAVNQELAIAAPEPGTTGPTPAAPATSGGKDGADRRRAPAQDEAAAHLRTLREEFRRGRKFDVVWSWGGQEGDLVLTILDARDDGFRAKLGLAADPSAARWLSGRIVGSSGSVRLSTVPGDGLPRQGIANPYTRDPSRRWLYSDVQFELPLTGPEGGWRGKTRDTTFRLEPRG